MGLDAAMHSFQTVFHSKSGNAWPLKKPFEKKKGKYTLIGEFPCKGVFSLTTREG